MRSLTCSAFAALDAPAAQPFTCTWPELCESLADSTERATKGGPGWAPTTFEPSHRLKANARHVHALVVDLDDCTTDQLLTMTERIAPYAYAVHSTWTPGRYRLVMPLATPVTADDWHSWAWSTCTALLGIPVDESCCDASRFYFVPSHQPGNEPTFDSNVGAWLEAHSLPRVAASAPRRAASDRTPLTGGDFEKEIRAALENPEIFDVEKLRTMARRLPSPKNVQLLGILEHKPIAQPGYRDAQLNRVMKLAAFHWPVMEPEEMMALARPSIEAMDCSPEGVEHWVGIAQSQYHRGLEFRFAEQRRRNAIAAAADDVARSRSGPKNFGSSTAGSSSLEYGNEAAAESGGEGDGAAADWLASLDWKLGKNGSREALNKTGRNLATILEHDPETRGFIRWHEFRQVITITGGTFAKTSQPALETTVGNWLEKKYQLSLAKPEIFGQLLAVALEHRLNPLKEQLLAAKWDGIQRARKFLFEYAVCEGNHTHLARIGEKFLVSAVARALDPGCKVDTVLILQGVQGARKSTFFEVLAGGTEYFTDQRIDMHDKDSQMVIGSKWIVELSELSSFRRSDTEEIKSFISKRVDQYRAPYERSVVQHPRRCIFVGSTNSMEFLTDDTGNRRFWPVSVRVLDIERLKADREQLIAEAVHLYQSGTTWWLEGEEHAIAEEEATLFKTRSAFFESIYGWYLDMKPEKRPAEVTTTFIAMTVLGVSRSTLTSYLLREIAQVLLEMGCTIVRKRTIAGRNTQYVFPTHLRQNLNTGVDKPVMSVVQGEDAEDREVM